MQLRHYNWGITNIKRISFIKKCQTYGDRFRLMNNLKSFSRHFQDQVHLKIEYFDHIQIRTHTAGSPCNLLYIYIKKYNTEKNTVTKINHGQQKYLDFMMETLFGIKKKNCHIAIIILMEWTSIVYDGGKGSEEGVYEWYHETFYSNIHWWLLTHTKIKN